MLVWNLCTLTVFLKVKNVYVDRWIFIYSIVGDISLLLSLQSRIHYKYELLYNIPHLICHRGLADVLIFLPAAIGPHVPIAVGHQK